MFTGGNVADNAQLSRRSGEWRLAQLVAMRADGRHNHTSTICGSSSGRRFNWIKPRYRLRKTFRTSLSDLELIDFVAGPVKIFRDDELPRHVFARIVFRVLVHPPHDEGRHRFPLRCRWKKGALISMSGLLLR